MYARLCSFLNLLLHSGSFLIAGMFYHAFVTLPDMRHVGLMPDYSVSGVRQRFIFFCFSLLFSVFVRASFVRGDNA